MIESIGFIDVVFFYCALSIVRDGWHIMCFLRMKLLPSLVIKSMNEKVPMTSTGSFKEKTKQNHFVVEEVYILPGARHKAPCSKQKNPSCSSKRFPKGS